MSNKQKIEHYFLEKIVLFPYCLVINNKKKWIRQIALISTILWICIVGILFVPVIFVFTIKGLLDLA